MNAPKEIPKDEDGGTLARPRLRIQPAFFADQIAAKLYEGPFGCLWEAIRNGWAAGMTRRKSEPTRWNHLEAAAVHLWFENEHPFAPTDHALMVGDTGKGMTPDDLERFSDLGPGINEPVQIGGASQNRMGRLGAVALNRNAISTAAQILNENEGAFWLTRTAAKGPVTKLQVTSGIMAQGHSYVREEIAADSPLLGRWRNREGSFTLVVIPYPRITAAEILEELPWALPRRADRALQVTVEGKPVKAVPLPRNPVPIGEVDRMVCLLHAEATQDPERGGIWACDWETGFRVFRLHVLGAKADPLSRDDVTGCVFFPRLLEQMDSSRKGMRPDHWRTEDGKLLLRLLNLPKVRGHVEALLGERTGWRGAGNAFLETLVDIFGNADRPKKGGLGGTGGGTRPPGEDPKARPEGSDKPDPDPTGEPTKPKPDGSGGGRPRGKVWITVNGKAWLLRPFPQSDEAWIARLLTDGHTIEVNTEHQFTLELPPNIFRHHAFSALAGAIADDPTVEGGSNNDRDRNKRHDEILLKIYEGERNRKREP